MQNETFFIPLNNIEPKLDLQKAFEKFLKSRQEQLKPKKDIHKLQTNTRIRNDNSYFNINLRELFLRQAYQYIGVPYAQRYWTVEDEEYYSPRFLDCCALVRRVMKDLRSEFGFSLGPWNQGYIYDLLPIEYTDPGSMQPGDLVFVEGVYYNEKRNPQKHNIMHVEIWVGNGEKTLGARLHKGKVQIFDSYKYISQNYEIKRYVFKSIDTWLQGICRSFCQEHNWHFKDHFYDPGKYSIFSNFKDEDQEAAEEDPP